MKKNEAVILPGSYDPPTLGHLDMITRAAEQYSEVYAVIFQNPEKKYTFSLDERTRMLILATDHLENVLVSSSSGLVIDYMREHGISKIIKGFRNETDLEYEKKQAEWNMRNGGYETELWPADEALAHVSSTLARKKILDGEDTGELLSPEVADFINKLEQSD